MKDISIVIQAGGKSKRMGTDKGLLNFKSVALIEYIINQVKELSDDLIIIQIYRRKGLDNSCSIIENAHASRP